MVYYTKNHILEKHMNKDTDNSLIRALVAGLPDRLFLSHAAIEQLRRNENLSPAGLLNINTIMLCHQHMHHICHFIEYLTSGHNTPEIYGADSFDSEEIISGIAKTFTGTISGYASVTATYCSKLKTSYPVHVNKTRFETVFLNILYSCLKSDDILNNKKTKITLSVHETKKNIIFHIQTNCTLSNPEILQHFHIIPPNENTEMYSRDVTLALSLEIADRFIREENGSLTYKQTKSGSRFDITLPKLMDLAPSKLSSPRKYIPSYTLFEETFADFALTCLNNRLTKEDILL